MIFCKAGKDRTGIISALVLAVAGCDDEQIIKDYIRSATWRANVGGRSVMVARKGIDEHFVDLKY